MNATKQAALDAKSSEALAELSSLAPTQRQYARYVMEMSAELARVADKGKLPKVIGYTLRVAALAAQQQLRKSVRSDPEDRQADT